MHQEGAGGKARQAVRNPATIPASMPETDMVHTWHIPATPRQDEVVWVSWPSSCGIIAYDT